jgi:class 3 adenylate cyclase/tetratricopeptide (TPR) repeat protein
MEVESWLRDLGLGQYAKAFRDNAVDGDVLPTLTAEDLADLGVSAVGHRRKLLNAIADLRAAGQSRAGRAQTVSQVEAAGERRQVTVLFADLAGFTSLGSELDSEDVHALLENFFGRADRIIEENGGRIDKHIGDCVMAVFGAPVAHGNDAERAVRAALAIREVMPDVSAGIRRPIGVHIGVAGGQVVASRTGSTSHSEYTVTGETVNLASRLTAAAATGEILISSDTRRALADRLDCDEVGALAVKGLAEPVTAWRLHGLRRPAREERPFVGRRGELRLIEAALAACQETSRGQTIHLRGEAGIGKTRLIEEVQRIAAASGFACHAALVLDFGAGAGRDAVRALARSLLGLEVTSGAEAVRAAAENILSANLVPREDEVFLNDLLDLPQPADLRGVYTAMESATRTLGRQRVVGDMIARLSRHQPRLAVVEDLHWADRPTLAHLAAVMPQVERSPVLLVLTSRVEGDPLDARWRAEMGGRPLTSIELGPLPAEDAQVLAKGFLAASSALAERCLERAAGNPLFLEQLLRHAQESSDARVPGTIQSLVQARLDLLDPVDKTAVQAASVLGQRFTEGALAHLLGQASRGAERLAVHHLVRRTSGETFLFSHALIRDAVYDTLLKSRRRELHRRAAEWYAGRDVVLHAEHLDRAEAAEAACAYLAAARSQTVEYRQEAALRLVERGIALAKDRSDVSELTCLKGEIFHDLGAMPDAARAYQAAFEAAANDAQRCAAWIGGAAVKRVTDDLPGAFADLEQAETVAVAQNLVPQQARIRFLRGNLFFPRGDMEGCLREHGAALKLARQAGEAEIEAMALSGMGDAEYLCGRMISAQNRFRCCIELCVAHGFGRVEVANRPMLAFTHWYKEGPAAAISDADEAIAAAARVGHRRAEMIGHHAACFIRIDLLDLEAALCHAEAALALSRHLGARRFDAEALALRAEVRRRAGRRAEALADAREAARISNETAPSFIGPYALGILALATEDPSERRAALDQGEALLDHGAVSHNHLLFRRDALEASLDAADWDRVERLASALERYTHQEPLPWSDFHIRRARALAARAGVRSEPAWRADMQKLIEEGEHAGFRAALASLEAALGAVRR